MPTFELLPIHEPLFLTEDELLPFVAQGISRFRAAEPVSSAQPLDKLGVVLLLLAHRVATAQLKKAGDLGCLTSPKQEQQ